MTLHPPVSADSACETPTRDRANQRRLLALIVASTTWWLFAFAATESGKIASLGPALGVAGVQAGLGLGLALAYRRFLLETDELRRKIELEGLALGAGIAVAGGFTAMLLVSADVVSAAAGFAFFALPFFAYGGMVSHRLRSYS